jgi:two-component system OmpR family sensor kinase
MLRSLRFQLPALFLLAILIAGLVSAAIALRLFRTYAENRSRQQAYAEVGREANGITQLYSQRAGRRFLSARGLELATGDRIFFSPRAPGLDLFPGQKGRPFTPLPKGVVNERAIRQRRKPLDFVFQPPGSDQKLLAAALPLNVGDSFFGTLVVAKPETVLNQRWVALIERLLLAFAGGVLVAGAFGWYLSRRITTPVLQLTNAADEVARGNYEVEVPSSGAGEIGLLADRFGQMASRLSESEELERNFLMSVTHELRTPLTAIRGHVEALREGVVADEETRSASFEVIADEAERLERLVGDVLDLAKLDAHRFTVLQEEVDMERLVDRAYTTFTEEARRRRIEYRRELEAKPVIVSDGDRVLQIISNLLSNAFRWTPDGGSVGLELSATDGSVYVGVADSGPGIPPSERERIFRPFWSRGGGGTGLGLAIANELAAALGGRISLESSAEKGSRFELMLPVRPR